MVLWLAVLRNMEVSSSSTVMKFKRKWQAWIKKRESRQGKGPLEEYVLDVEDKQRVIIFIVLLFILQLIERDN